MDQRILQLVERLLEGRTDQMMDKHEVLDKAHAWACRNRCSGTSTPCRPGA